jgi:DNA-directed RNA polymerase subunit RPC12/RpoP
MNTNESSSSPPPAPPGEPDRSDLAGQGVDAGKGRIFPCEGCGADLKFNIGQQHLKCPFCGFEKELQLSEDAQIEEQDFHAMLARVRELREQDTEESNLQAGEETANEVRCESCGANVVFWGR